jgi:hypothetical protein
MATAVETPPGTNLATTETMTMMSAVAAITNQPWLMSSGELRNKFLILPAMTFWKFLILKLGSSEQNNY